MKTFVITLFFTISVIFTPNHAFADELKATGCETAIDCTVTQGNTTTTVTTATTTNGSSPLRRAASGSTTTTTETTGSNFGSAGQAGTGAYTQAEAAKSSANGTMLAAFGMAAMLAAMCSNVNKVPCVLSPLAAMAGMMAGQKKGEAQRLMDQLGTGGTGGNTQGTVDGAITTAGTVDSPDYAASQFAKVKADLAKKGYGLNEDGSFTAPNGQTVASDLNSQSLQAAGMNPSEIGKLGSDIDKLRRDIAAQSENAGAVGDDQNIAGVGSGFGGARTKLFSDEREASRAIASNTDRVGVDSDSAAWTGFSTRMGDSSIGVPQSDIFLMVEKRVESERKIMEH